MPAFVAFNGSQNSRLVFGVDASRQVSVKVSASSQKRQRSLAVLSWLRLIVGGQTSQRQNQLFHKFFVHCENYFGAIIFHQSSDQLGTGRSDNGIFVPKFAND